MKTLIGMTAILMLITLTFPAWTDTTAQSQMCFNVTTGSSMYLYSASESTVIDIALPQNGSFFSSAISLYPYDAFLYAENATDAFLFLPAVTGNNTQYCIYSGGVAMNDLSGVAKSYMDGSGAGSFSTPYGYSAPSFTGGHADFYGSSVSRLADSMTSTSIYMIKARMKANQTSSTLNYAGIGNNVDRFAHSSGWYGTYGGFTYPATPNVWMIAEARFSQTVQNNTLYNDSMYRLNGSSASHTSDTGNSYLIMQASGNNMSVDWFVGSRIGSTSQVFAATNLAWDSQDMNISILNPSEGSQIAVTDTVAVVIQLGQSYDNCSIYVNGMQKLNLSSSDAGIHQGTYQQTASPGSRLMRVSCYLSGVESHAYRNYVAISAPVSALFTSAFGYDPTTTCSGTVISALSSCTESYRIPSMYNFSSVVCPGLNMSVDYSCLALSNYTKGGYGIFYAPSYWQYANGLNVEHVGAEFYYNNAPVTMGMEIIDNTTFIYIPGQQKPHDADVYYSNTSYPSNGWGFTVNDRQVVVSDGRNNWFLAAGNGITQYNANYSQIVIPVSVIPLAPLPQAGNATGFYTRLNCYPDNSSYVVQIVSTVQKAYTVSVGGNTSYSYSSSSYNLYDSIPLSNGTTVNITANGEMICFYDGSSNLFLPFNLAWLGDGFGKIFIAVLMLFSVILSAIIPYALVIPFLLNDIYHVITVQQMGVLVVLAMVGGLVNNVFALERGVKNMVILLAITISFIVTLGPYTGPLGIDFGPLTTLLSSFNNMIQLNGDFTSVLWSFITGLPTFVINLFVVVLTVPLIIIGLIYALIAFISPAIASAAAPFKTPLVIGAMIVYMLKAYEILSNRFRNL